MIYNVSLNTFDNKTKRFAKKNLFLSTLTLNKVFCLRGIYRIKNFHNLIIMILLTFMLIFSSLDIYARLNVCFDQTLKYSLKPIRYKDTACFRHKILRQRNCQNYSIVRTGLSPYRSVRSGILLCLFFFIVVYIRITKRRGQQYNSIFCHCQQKLAPLSLHLISFKLIIQHKNSFYLFL